MCQFWLGQGVVFMFCSQKEVQLITRSPTTQDIKIPLLSCSISHLLKHFQTHTAVMPILSVKISLLKYLKVWQRQIIAWGRQKQMPSYLCQSSNSTDSQLLLCVLKALTIADTESDISLFSRSINLQFHSDHFHQINITCAGNHICYVDTHQFRVSR